MCARALGEFHCQHSGFGGHPLPESATFTEDEVDQLAELGIFDAEQLIGLAAVPFMKSLLARELGISDRQMDNLVAEAADQVPPRRRAALEVPADDEFGLGALEPTFEMLQASLSIPLASAAEVGALTGSVNWASEMPPIRDQAHRGTCVAFGATAVNEFLRPRPTDFSEQYLYARTKLIDGYPTVCGTWLAKSAVVLAANGECRESIMPYNPNAPCNQNDTITAAADGDAHNYRVALRQLNPRDVGSYKTSLASHKVVGFCIPVYNSWYQSSETYRSGRITMRVGNEPSVGGHCMCIVGYQDDGSSPGGGYFILRNSWGSGFGYQSPYGVGNGTIPFQYIANDGTEAFTLP